MLQKRNLPSFKSKEEFILNKIEDTNDKSKLFLYKQIKKITGDEFYLNSQNFMLRKYITKLRLSDHNLEIEKGRHFNIPRNERLCPVCKILGDEFHILLNFHINKNLRDEYMHNILVDFM